MVTAKGHRTIQWPSPGLDPGLLPPRIESEADNGFFEKPKADSLVGSWDICAVPQAISTSTALLSASKIGT